MTTKLTHNLAPIIAIRQRAEAYPQRLAQDMVQTAQRGFGTTSPAPLGAPPARKSGALSRSIVAVRVDKYRWRVTVWGALCSLFGIWHKAHDRTPVFSAGIWGSCAKSTKATIDNIPPDNNEVLSPNRHLQPKYRRRQTLYTPVYRHKKRSSKLPPRPAEIAPTP